MYDSYFSSVKVKNLLLKIKKSLIFKQVEICCFIAILLQVLLTTQQRATYTKCAFVGVEIGYFFCWYVKLQSILSNKKNTE